ncbi:MAG: branched-chain amino acid ABC transporter permease [Deltaproteobacteria bacterium]|nr:branched-chain amino acid ABC transporter permease [Deltaproteobacteria bacterium]
MVSAELAQSLLSGVLMGLIFALVAVGLTLIWGIMDIVNFAHGDFLMAGMYISFWMYTLWGIDPVFSLPASGILLFLLGVVTYRLVIRRIIGAPMLIQIFTTFGIMILLRYVAFYFFKPNYRSIQKTLISGTVNLGGVYLSIPQAVAAAGALVTTGAVYFLIHRTRVGGALQATAEDRDAASLMGIDTDRMFTLAWGIGAATAGIAGSLLSTFFYIFPEVGGIFGLTAFVAVTLGGFGNVAGAFFAGILIGVVEALAGYLYDPALKTIFVYLLFLGVLFFRPQGLLGVE